MELLEFIEKQLKNRYQITKIQCLDKIDREPELVLIFFQKECAIEKVIEKIRKNSGRYSVVILFEEDLDQMDRVVSSFPVSYTHLYSELRQMQGWKDLLSSTKSESLNRASDLMRTKKSTWTW